MYLSALFSTHQRTGAGSGFAAIVAKMSRELFGPPGQIGKSGGGECVSAAGFHSRVLFRGGLRRQVLAKELLGLGDFGVPLLQLVGG